MDEFDKIEFKVDFNDLPDTEEEMGRSLSKEEKQQLASEPAASSTALLRETDVSKLIEQIIGRKDAPGLMLTKGELAETLFHAPMYVNELRGEQQKMVAQFLSNAEPRNGKFFVREELLAFAKDLLLVLN